MATLVPAPTTLDYAPAKTPLIKKPLLVIGTPRSGTTTCAHLVRLYMGLDVGHEEMGVDGIVYGHWAVPRLLEDPSLELEPIQRQDYQFARVVHLVRHPLATIESLRREMAPQFWTWQELHTGIAMDVEDGEKPDWPEIAAFWCAWYDICEDQSHEGWAIEMLSAHAPGLEEWKNTGMNYPRYFLSYEDLGAWEEQVKERAKDCGYL